MAGADVLLAGTGTGPAGAHPLGAFAITLARRVAAMVVVLLILSFGIFMLQYLAPGSVEAAVSGGRRLTPEQLSELRARYRLDQPVLVQYFSWLGHAVQGDFGTSYRTNEAVTPLMLKRMALSAQLAALAFVFAMLIGLPLAILAATRPRSATDRFVSGTAAVGVAAPPFAIAVLLLYVFGVELGWFPVFGAGVGFTDRVWHLVLPATALAIGTFALIIKITRAALTDALNQDYVTFARARGLGRRRVLATYGFRNSLAPVVTAAGLTFTSLLAATVFVETTFALPGAGSLLIESLSFKDIPVVQALSMALAAGILLVNLLTDLTYAVIDPRIDLTKSLQ